MFREQIGFRVKAEAELQAALRLGIARAQTRGMMRHDHPRAVDIRRAMSDAVVHRAGVVGSAAESESLLLMVE